MTKKNNIFVENLISEKCLKRPCYVPTLESKDTDIIYVCARKEFRDCPSKYKG